MSKDQAHLIATTIQLLAKSEANTLLAIAFGINEKIGASARQSERLRELLEQQLTDMEAEG